MYRIVSLLGLGILIGLYPVVTGHSRENGWISTCDGLGCGGRGSPCYEYTYDGGQSWHYCYFR
ncbi:MAG TPA: hypothetical protein VNH46_13485 [Gemmatimonadales bacterium]|nr:hypothetical protein [Gemmatimonadales bacterium]